MSHRFASTSLKFEPLLAIRYAALAFLQILFSSLGIPLFRFVSYG